MTAAANNPLYQAFWRQLLPATRWRELALLISGSPEVTSAELLRWLAERCGFVCAVDSGADRARAAGITPDLLIGDFDSIEPLTLEGYRQEGVKLKRFDPYKDASDLELAIAELSHRGVRALVGAQVLGGRTDHALAALGNFVQARDLQTALIADRQAVVFLSAEGMRKSLELDFANAAKPAVLSLIPFGGAARVSECGTEWELHDVLLEPTSSRGISNAIIAEQLHISVTQGDLLVIFQYELC
jgi:thiamine pyrophosphokinase